MVFLKEDGSLDIERINQLPLEEWMDMVGQMTKEQYVYFESKCSLNESKEPYTGVILDSKMIEKIENAVIETEDFFNNKRKKYGYGKCDDI